MDISRYDRRRYTTVPVKEGYGQWVDTYEDTVEDLMDLRLLDRLTMVDWPHAARVVDLACGTGRIGVWLRTHDIGELDGVDMTPEMLSKEHSVILTAHRKPFYNREKHHPSPIKKDFRWA